MNEVTVSKSTPVLHAPSTAETVFAILLQKIVEGSYPCGSRLPAERELARQLGASRPTLREALRRLAEWKLVEARRGSGITVRERRSWSIEALPAFLRYGRSGPGEPVVASLLQDLLTLRRVLTLEIITIATPRIPPGGTRVPRAALARAWSSRDEPQVFVREDLDITRSLVEQAQFFPALWLLNRVAEVYLEIASVVSGALAPPPDYRSAHEALFDAIEQGDVSTARNIYCEYMDRHDQKLLATIEAFS